MTTLRFTQWVANAACGGVDRDLFFPETDDAEAVAPAKAICAGCPVREPCRAHALDHPAELGIWGGMTESERTRERLRLRPGHAA